MLRVFLALLAVRNLQIGLTIVLLNVVDGALVPISLQAGPPRPWLAGPDPGRARRRDRARGGARRFLRLRLVTAAVVGLALELLVGPSDLSLVRFLMLNGLEQALMFSSPTAVMAGPGQLGDAVQSPLSYVGFVGPVIWAFVLQQVALRAADPEVAGNVLKIDWRASGSRVDEFGAAVYRADPRAAPSTDRFPLFQRQYLEPVVLDSAGSLVQQDGGGGGLPRSRPYVWHEQTVALIPGAGEYTLQVGCAAPVQPPIAKGSPGGGCGGAPNATIAIVVS